ncbi:MAG TPA: succinylglutamate desuccinylase/aspartoacylase family protein [Longimicrobiaceae bacterium]|nr:succinylglutamate desuccinylase/aspartoacylase family protein [Longimicrobiaceae bacterium]
MTPEGARGEPAGEPVAERRESIEVDGIQVAPGTREDIDIHVERLASGPWISIPTIVIHGRRPGPSVSVSAAVHGDEINGVEVARRLLSDLRPSELAGTLFVIPVVNQLGFMSGQRYLPDRRDLNRSFPGSPRGSLAARLAHLFMTEIISRCEYGIDLHSGSDNRANWPQIRADLDDPRIREAADAFGAPITLHARLRDGSLREAATQRGMAMLLFEGGEDNRYDDYAIDAAHQGVLRVLAHLEMIDSAPGSSAPTLVSRSSRWVRAQRGGLLRSGVSLGDEVERRQVLGQLSDIYGRSNLAVRAPLSGVVIGKTRTPRVNQGDALFHIAEPQPRPATGP